MNCDSLIRFSQNISKLIECANEYNVIIRVGKPPNVQEFKAHSLILRARSSYFHAALSSEWAKTHENIILFNKPNIKPETFDSILR